jgi:hypothetical protein
MVSRAVSAKSGIPRYVLTAYGCTIISTTLWSEKIIFASDFIIFVQQKWQTINQSNLTPVLAELMQAATVAHEIVASKIQIHFELLASVIQQMTGHVSTPFIKHMKSRHLQTKIQYTPDRIHHTCAYYLFYNLYVVNRSLERNCIPRYVGRYPPMSTYLGMRNLPQRRKKLWVFGRTSLYAYYTWDEMGRDHPVYAVSLSSWHSHHRNLFVSCVLSLFIDNKRNIRLIVLHRCLIGPSVLYNQDSVVR